MRRAAQPRDGAADATGEVVDVVVDPAWGPVLAGAVVDVVEPPDGDEVDADLPEWILGRVVVVVVVVEPVVADAAPSTCWAWLSCWSMALMADWYPARSPAASAAFALL